MSFSKVLHTEQLKNTTELVFLSLLTTSQSLAQYFAKDILFRFSMLEAQSLLVHGIVDFKDDNVDVDVAVSIFLLLKIELVLLCFLFTDIFTNGISETNLIRINKRNFFCLIFSTGVF